ncbi:hypothetical protein [Brevibacterium sp. RIT 803]|uniref:hypothetical protein n=1 Tax=Brevibacterium sp. RIT 803 TaxID=2810210 RepID=UPI001951599F|nr:hypothetical protein [Brevibacterium sp. RIT 803]MBM6589356.1 hypothetical protein [Brevibacterium sp. RIT 803]
MSTLITPTRSPSLKLAPGRIVERTTTITREIFLDDPAARQSQSGTETVDELQRTSSVAADDIHGVDRALVRLGVWLIEAGRRHALRPSANPDEIARRVDAAKTHDMRNFIGLPN